MADANPSEIRADDAAPIAAENHAAAEEEAAIKAASRKAQRRVWLTRLAIVVLVVAVGYGLWYFLIGRNHVSTDNAYVNAEVAQVTPLVAGQAIEVNVKDTQAVKRGDILVKLDPSNQKIAVAQAEAELAEARRKFRQSVATNAALSAQISARGSDIAAARAQGMAAQAEFEKARIDLSRRQALSGNGAVSGEELSSARQAFQSARAQLAQAQAAIAQAESTRTAAQGQYAANDALVRGSSEDTDPAVQAARAKLDAARLDLERTVIRAPIDGTVTKRQVQLGQRVAQGTPIMTIVPLTQVYIDANFKERQLERVRIGMPATAKADIYGGSVTYHGKVAGIAGGTGASMALIPAQNATGNWIKVVQRLPVRIELDPKEVAEHPLRVGLSMEVEIDVAGN
ncbi:EmrA/EmrK family multidrug efflux transporter periplasmic adaptor subunit [Novosphingobium sp. JCM 18896]|uniref:EmrA/EmrK family multidrug efflux transporter periplasmic adaptor subunit n=1 Tax=Novosphingobium sp. JCM 18896 TaxID=2989731 RepID=UPI0022215FC6|nr:EmrA/EmrK family multidrug efflux transporter periplasmic adaptor subunit [Novosphingobium sp. JCM 18896]MCW1428659.1 EmrA/EmrK family multidrug efflux transporter periplasmic adaptor subunit [Novosphingobium sp. JCM 18896]